MLERQNLLKVTRMVIRSAERRRIAELLVEHYSARRIAIDKVVTSENISHYVTALSDAHQMTARIAALEAARRQVESLQHSLLESACELKLLPGQRRELSADELRSVVHKHGYGKSYVQVLNEVARTNITLDSALEERKKRLFVEEQQRLAELALVTSEAGLLEFFKDCEMVPPATKVR